MNKPIFVQMVGLVGSGKSCHAEKLAKEIDATVFSSDKLREEMFGDVNEQSKNGDLFQELHKRIKECLKSGNNAIYDATNLSSKRRRSFLQELNKIECEKRCIVMATPFEQCLKNNASRDRKVPEEVIDKMYRSWNTPAMFEGWDDIQVVYWNESKHSDNVAVWLFSHINYNQCNSHHTMTLGKHCIAVGKRLNDNDVLKIAGFIHDCGKPYTMRFKNSKGDPTEFAHYYGHENVGSYNALFFDCVGADPLDVSVLVGLHMTPYYWEKDNNEKLHNKYRKLWGEELYNSVMKLHEADKSAH